VIKLTKATSNKDVKNFEQIPNIGKKMAMDFKLLGIKKPSELAKKDPYKLYVQLCEKTNSHQDPCVLDVIIAAVDFMQTGIKKDWWMFTEERKKNYANIKDRVEKHNTISWRMPT
jgi:hypothetical protein